MVLETRYELGVNSSLSESICLDVTAYYNGYSDLQVNGTSPITNAFPRVNAGNVVTFGLETDLDWQLPESLRLGAFVGTQYMTSFSNTPPVHLHSLFSARPSLHSLTSLVAAIFYFTVLTALF